MLLRSVSKLCVRVDVRVLAGPSSELFKACDQLRNMFRGVDLDVS